MWVWWDVKSCPVRDNGTFIIETIRSALDDYGDTLHISTAKGVIKHFDIPYSTQPSFELFDAEYSAEEIICDMQQWAEKSSLDNINMLLITADETYQSILGELCGREYNILLVHDLYEHSPNVRSLIPLANCVWTLKSFLKGGRPYIIRPIIQKSELKLDRKFDSDTPPILIFWDTNTCPLPVKYDDIRSNIVAALYKMNHFGHVTIVAYGRFSEEVFYLVSEMSMHIIVGGIDDMMEDLLFWEWSHFHSTNVLIITDDKSCKMSYILDKLHSQGLSILQTHDDSSSDDDIYENATCVWKLTSLLNGLPPYKNCEDMVHYRFKKAQDRRFNYYGAPICIWWDTVSCPLPEDCSNISHNILLALNEMDFRGPVKMTTYVGLCSEKSNPAHAFISFMDLTHLPPDSLIQSMMKDMKSWVIDHQSPANFLIISGDKALLPTIRKLRQYEFNVLVAHGDGESTDDIAEFVENASHVWRLSSLLSGKSAYKISKCFLV